LANKGKPDSHPGHKRFILESLFMFAVAFQISMYVWRNVNTEIQLQGKYILPIFIPVLVLFLSAIQAGMHKLAEALRNRNIKNIELTASGMAGAALLGISVIAVASHIDALVNHVIPFYNPPVYKLNSSQFIPLAFSKKDILSTNDLANLELVDGGLRLESTGNDSQIVFGPGVCEQVTGNILLRTELESDRKGEFHIFVDYGNGYDPDRPFKHRYPRGHSEFIVAMGNEPCRKFRLDPTLEPGVIYIKSISYAKLRIGDTR
jgi:hypothetical protein